MKSERPVALVTGSTSGIGEAIARRLTADGTTVVIHSRSSQDTGHRLAHELHGTYLQADLADPQATASLAENALTAYGRLDVLVNNAGISWPILHSDLAAATPSDWRRLLEVNLIAPWILCTEALPAFEGLPLPRRRQHRQYHQLGWSPTERLVHPIRRDQSRAQPRHDAARRCSGTRCPSQRCRPRIGRHPDDTRLD
jgi:NAD(P)-dependent dehydrogenase (short-subunit alcohol dehydrogenase family)